VANELNELCLSEEMATIVDAAEAGLVADNKILIRQWRMSDTSQTMHAVRALQQRVSIRNPVNTTSNFVKDPMVNGETREGIWRLSSVRGVVSGENHYVRQVLLYGLVKSPDALPTPELVTRLEQVLIPHNDIDGSKRTYREVRYKAIDPSYVETLEATIAVSSGGTSSTKIVKMEDGSYNIHAMVDNTVWETCYVETVVGAKWDTDETTEYRFNIDPGDIGGFVAPYTTKEVGKEKRVSLSHNNDDGTYNFVGVVRAIVGQDDYTMASALYINCDTTIQYAFLWSATQAESDLFLADYVDPPPAGVSRELQINHRDDGLLDVTILIKTVVPHADPTIPDFEIAIPIGSIIVKTESRGFNINLDEIDAVVAVYEAKKAAGTTVEFAVTRKNDCTFDYVANVTVTGHIGKSLELDADTDYGLDMSLWSGLYASTNDDLPAASKLPVGARERVSIDIVPNQDETFSYKIVRTRVGATNESGTIQIGAAGTGITVASGKNASVSEFAAALSGFTSGARKSHDVSFTANDDKTIDYVIRESAVQEVSGSKVYDKNTTYYGRNADALPTITDVLRSISVSGNEDGTLNYQITVEELFTAVGEVTDNDTGGNTNHVQYGINQDSVPVPTGGKLRSVSVSQGDNGKTNYHLVSGDIFSGAGTYTDGNVTLWYGEAEDTIPDVSAERIRSASVSFSDNGKLNYAITTVADFTLSSDIADSVTYNKRHYQHGMNQAAVATPTGERVLSVQISEGDKGRYNFVIISEDKDEIVGNEFVAKIDGLLTDNVTAVSGSATEPSVTVDGEYISDLRMDDGGLYSYLKHRLELDPSPIYYDERTSKMEWDIKDHQITMPAWADGAGGGWRYITHYVEGLVSYSRHRKVDITTQVTLSLAVPVVAAPDSATFGTFGGYEMHTTVVKQVGDLWAMIVTDTVADDWSEISVTPGEIIFDWSTIT